MMLKSKQFWRPVIWSCVVGLLVRGAYGIYLMSRGFESSSGGWWILIYPIPFLMKHLSISEILSLTNFVPYGIILGIGCYKDKAERYLAVLVGIHIIACIVAFVAQ